MCSKNRSVHTVLLWWVGFWSEWNPQQSPQQTTATILHSVRHTRTNVMITLLATTRTRLGAATQQRLRQSTRMTTFGSRRRQPGIATTTLHSVTPRMLLLLRQSHPKTTTTTTNRTTTPSSSLSSCDGFVAVSACRFLTTTGSDAPPPTLPNDNDTNNNMDPLNHSMPEALLDPKTAAQATDTNTDNLSSSLSSSAETPQTNDSSSSSSSSSSPRQPRASSRVWPIRAAPRTNHHNHNSTHSSFSPRRRPMASAPPLVQPLVHQHHHPTRMVPHHPGSLRPQSPPPQPQRPLQPRQTPAVSPSVGSSSSPFAMPLPWNNNKSNHKPVPSSWSPPPPQQGSTGGPPGATPFPNHNTNTLTAPLPWKETSTLLCPPPSACSPTAAATRTNTEDGPPKTMITVADYLTQQYEWQRRHRPTKQNGTAAASAASASLVPVPTTNWVELDNIPPLSSLEAMVQGLEEALDAIWEAEGGIWNLEAPIQSWDSQTGQPHLPTFSDWSDVQAVQEPHHEPQHEEEEFPNSSSLSSSLVFGRPTRWIQTAKLRLSLYGRPRGWLIQVRHRSVAYALLRYAQQHAIYCAWKPVTLLAHHGGGGATPPPTDTTPNNSNHTRTDSSRSGVVGSPPPTDNDNNSHDKDDYRPPTGVLVTDATVRLEDCPASITIDSLLKTFSRFDLATQAELKHRGIVPTRIIESTPNTTTTTTPEHWDGRDDDADLNDDHHQDDPTTTTTTNEETGWTPRPPRAFVPSSRDDYGCIVPWTPHVADQQTHLQGGTNPQAPPVHNPPLPPTTSTFLVHFASPAWARAAVREKQGAQLFNGRFHLRLAQYPKQIM